jgi:hypothetical protein
VSQVDEEGSLITEACVNTVGNLYTEDSLKTLARSKAPDCITKANDAAKGRYKFRTIWLFIPSDFKPSIIS